MEINAKRVQRLWRQEGLRVPRRQRKRARLGKSENGTQRLSAERVNPVWSYDFVMDQTEDGRRLKWLPICDEPFGHELRAEWFSRELVALEVERRMEARDVIRILDEAVAARLARPPTSLVPSASSADVCRSSSAATTARSSWPWPCGNGSRGGGSRRSPSSPAARGRTPTAKALSCRFRDEFLNREAFASVLEAKVLGKEHRQRHNQERPHSSLDYQTPVEFAQRSLAAASATLRQPQGCALPANHLTTNPNPENQPKLS